MNEASPRILVAGIGNIFLGDALLENFDHVILIDAVPRGEPPGTLFVIEPDLASLNTGEDSQALIDAHGMQPERVIRSAASMGANLRDVLLVGCEPTPFDAEQDMQMELSPPVLAAVDEAVQVVRSLICIKLQDERNLAGVGASSIGHVSDAARESHYDCT
jgi:hydrogenase maturation protease